MEKLDRPDKNADGKDDDILSSGRRALSNDDTESQEDNE